MPGDVQLVMRLNPGSQSFWEDGGGPVGGFEPWISFPRD
jgi:hypothetical protein